MSNACKAFSAERMASLIEHISSTYSAPDFQTYLHALELKMCSRTDRKHLEKEIKRVVKGALAPYDLTRKEFEELIRHYRREGGDMERSLNEFELLRSPGLRCMLLDREAHRVRAAPPWLPASERLQSKRAMRKARGLPKDWEVTGASCAGGVTVRLGESLQSPALSVRLASGAVVRELNMAGSRLHYEKISGGGPMYGWVSIVAQGATQLELVSPTGQDASPEEGGGAPAEAAGGKCGASASSETRTTCASEAAIGSDDDPEAAVGSDDDLEAAIGSDGDSEAGSSDSSGGWEIADAVR